MMTRYNGGDDLRDLYQDMILDHNRNPRNFGPLEGANRRSEGFNPLCGDKITVYLHLDGDVIRDIHFDGSGCAISKASASIMTTVLKGKSISQAEELFREFHEMVTEGNRKPPSETKLAVLAGVRKYPVRVKCATLAWHTMKNSLRGKEEVVSTE
ncbi:MAG: Fe-S cluster assembly sulfur transfer protein SufU [Fidelibacterota bacterium]